MNEDPPQAELLPAQGERLVERVPGDRGAGEFKLTEKGGVVRFRGVYERLVDPADLRCGPVHREMISASGGGLGADRVSQSGQALGEQHVPPVVGRVLGKNGRERDRQRPARQLPVRPDRPPVRR
jgi:hypothetical protein